MNDAVREDVSLGIAGFSFSDLYEPRRLRDLHAKFWEFAEARSSGLAQRFSQFGAGTLAKPAQSELLIDVAIVVGEFLERLFEIHAEANRLRDETRTLDAIFQFKRDFLRARVFKSLDESAIDEAQFEMLDADVRQLVAASSPHDDPEVRFAIAALALLAAEKTLTAGEPPAASIERAQAICAHRPEPELASRVRKALELLAEWCVQVQAAPSRHWLVQGWVSFTRPHKLDYEQLIELDHPRSDLPEATTGPEKHRRLRDGFRLTDPRMNRKEVLREVDYCIICHPREKDSCSHGFKDTAGGHQRNPLGIPLTG
ncbi:MAG: hypothetical protein HY290_23455, partial [Planctomycetia bacterium]|nr:hypothetical protein [Planctomycetia bacterium]